MVGDIIAKKIYYIIISPKLIFYKDYNLLIYLKSALAASSRIKEIKS